MVKIILIELYAKMLLGRVHSRLFSVAQFVKAPCFHYPCNIIIYRTRAIFSAVYNQEQLILQTI